MNNCPPFCAIRQSLVGMPPERRGQAIAFVMNSEHTRKEVCQYLKAETGRTVYPNSVTRHRAHASTIDVFESPRSQSEPRQNILGWLQTEIPRLQALKGADPEAVNEAYWSYFDYLADDTGALDLSYFYTDGSLKALLALFEALPPAARITYQQRTQSK